MVEPTKGNGRRLSDRALYRCGEAALYRAARIHFRGRRGALRSMVRRYLKPHRRDRALLGALTSSVGRVLVVALLMLQTWATEVEAQSPVFSSSSPANATHATALNSNIDATFSQTMAPGTATSSTFVVHGGFIGKHSTGGTASTHKDGTYTSGGSATMTFNPGANFKPGELVQVSLTTGLLNNVAVPPTTPRVFQFRAAAGAGPAVFSNNSHDVDTPTNTTESLSLGDLDGDGDLDLVTGNQNQVNRVYLGKGNGTFTSGNDVDTPTNSTQSIDLGDLDGDGDLDLVTGNSGQVNRIYLGNGNGTFASGNDVDTPTNNTEGVSLGDLDGDGDLDLVTGNYSQVNRVYLGNGNGTFASGNDVDTPTNDTQSISLGDVDGDGDLDLVTGNYASQVIRTYLGNGNGTFASGNNVDTSNNTYSLVLGDLDGDGDLDMISGNNFSQVNRVFLGNGNGTFASSTNVDTPTNDTYALALGDLDGDSDLDLVTGNNNQVNRRYLSNGNGTFASGSDIATPTNSTRFVSLGDLDGDGDLDLVTGNAGQVNRVYLNNNTSFSSSSPTANNKSVTTTSNVSATFNQSMNAATTSTFIVHGGMTGKRAGTYSGASSTTLTFDPTSDFRAGELVEVTLTAGLQSTSGDALQPPRAYRFRAAASAGPAVFSNSSNDVDTPTNKTRSIVLGDLDGDSDLDLVTGNDAQVNRVYLGNGNGTFASGNDVDTPTNVTHSVVLGDVDGDSDLDLIAGNFNQVNRVYLGNGNGTFASGNDVDTPTNATTYVSLGDVDGDGDLDLVSGNLNQVNRVYLGNGNGTFASGNDVDTPTNITVSASLGDVDGDGDLDLVTGNSGQVNRVYLGNGNGTFASGNDVDTPTNSTNSIALGDVDGDGDLDLVTGNQSQVNRVYLGNGNGTFASGNDVDTPTNVTIPISLGDMDGDGDLDLVVGNSGQVNRVYLGNGNGTFASGSDIDTPTNVTKFVQLGDVDGDGDLDIVTGNFNQVNRVYLNAGNKDGTLIASGTLDESSAIALPSTATTSGAAVNLFDFTLTDGGGGDGLALSASQIVVNTSGTGPFANVTWLLNGPDASNVSGTYSSGTNKITFSGLSISVADGANETYTLRGYYSTATGLIDAATFSFSIDGDTDVTTSSSGSSMSGSNAAVTNAAAAQVGITATQLTYSTQPAPLSLTSSTQLDFTTDPIVTAQDANGNTDTDFTSTVTLAENGAGSSSFSNNSVAAVNGVATFSGLLLTYNATADQQTFGLTAAASGVTSATSNNLTADIAATQLVFITQPSPLALTSGTSLDFATDPIVAAQDANGNTDTDFTSTVTLAENGAGSSSFTNNSVAAVNGVTTFSGLLLTYNALDASSIALTASASGLTSATSSSFAVTAFPLVARNKGARTSEGGSVLLSTDLLQFTDAASTASQIVYTLGTAPTAGQLNKSGTALSTGNTFTQDDIDNGRISYTHSGDEVFGDGFSFTVQGSAGLSTSSFSFGLSINKSNDDPVIDVNQVLTLHEGEAVTITNGSLRVLDADALPQQIVYTPVTAPAHGSLSLGAFTQADVNAGRLTYRHDGSETTSDAFSFTIRDGSGGGLGTQTLQIQILPVNDAPVAPVFDVPQVDENQQLVLALTATDPEGDPVLLTLHDVPEGATLDGTNLTWQPTHTQAGRYALTAVYTDGQGGTSRLRFAIEVNDVPLPNQPPQAKILAVEVFRASSGNTLSKMWSPSQRSRADTPLRIRLEAHDPDAIGAGLSEVGVLVEDRVIIRQTFDVAPTQLETTLEVPEAVRRTFAGVVEFLPYALDIRDGRSVADASAGWSMTFTRAVDQLVYTPFSEGHTVFQFKGFRSDSQFIAIGLKVQPERVRGGRRAQRQSQVVSVDSARVEVVFADGSRWAPERYRLLYPGRMQLGWSAAGARVIHPRGLWDRNTRTRTRWLSQHTRVGVVSASIGVYVGPGGEERVDYLFPYVTEVLPAAKLVAQGVVDSSFVDELRSVIEELAAELPSVEEVLATHRAGEGEIAELPSASGLLFTYPNPFNASTAIRYQIAAPEWVRLWVYDVLGQQVRTLVDGTVMAGRYEVRWDGRNEAGVPVASGVYLSRLQVGKHTDVHRMLLLK